MLLLAATTPPACLALDPHRELSQYRQFAWNTRNGLPQSGALLLAQSARNGYVWIGTERGLVRFDGSRFVAGAPDLPGLADRRITALAITGDGSVWVSTNKGLFQLPDGKSSPVSPQHSVCSRGVTLLQRVGADLLAGTQHGHLCRLASGRWEIVGPAANHAPVQDALVTRDGDYWMGTAAGIWRRAGSSGHWQRLAAPQGLSESIFALAERRDGSVILGSTSGLMRWLDGRLERWSPGLVLRSDAVRALKEDRDGNLWVAHWPEGLVRVGPDGQAASFRDNSLLQSPITHFMEDREGNLWIGTSADGVLLLESAPAIPFDEPEGLDRQVVWSVLADRAGNVWMGTRKGLRRLDAAGHPARVPPALASRRTAALLEGRDDALWVGIATGVARIANGRVDEWLIGSGPAARAVTALAEHPEGGLWVGTAERGVYRFTQGRFERETGLAETGVRSLLVSIKGELWAATESGAYVRRNSGWKKVTAGTVGVFSVVERSNGDF